MTSKLLSISDLRIQFDTDHGVLEAIRGVSFDLHQGETLAIVGESGSGKSVTTKALMGLLAKNAKLTSGRIHFGDQELTSLDEKAYQHIRGGKIAMIFQDPMTALDPTMPIGKQISESASLHLKVDKKTANKLALDMLEEVGIPQAKEKFKAYPHQFSGGQRQRIVIAMALVAQPEIIIADEPTTALDVTIQAQILDLLKKMQAQHGMSIIFITHDLGVVANMADRVAIMYAGQIIEIGTSQEVFYHPQHPYTWGLLRAMPTLESATHDGLYAIPGNPPNLLVAPKGDAFAPRNDYALDIDYKEAPQMQTISSTHQVASWLLDARAPQVTVPQAIADRYAYFDQHYKGGES